jgi:hypothetical protein
MKIISGYPGGAAIAIETGEVDDRCGWLWSAECQATQTLTSLPTLPSQVNRLDSNFDPALLNNGSGGALRLGMPMAEPSSEAML